MTALRDELEWLKATFAQRNNPSVFAAYEKSFEEMGTCGRYASEADHLDHRMALCAEASGRRGRFAPVGQRSLIGQKPIIASQIHHPR